MSKLGAPRKMMAKIKDSTLYYPHQTEGIRIMARMTSFLLADEMGLGKSLQSLTVAAIDFEMGLAKRVLVVCPATLKENWSDEVAEHTNFSCLVLDGTPTQREAQLDRFEYGDPPIDILIVNYEQVKAHLDRLNAMKFDIAIYDEAHYLKNRKSARTKASMNLKIKRNFVMTGSPMLNRVDELWTLLHRIDPERFPSWFKFVNRYATYGGFKGKQIVGVRNPTELNDELSLYMIRRLKSEVLELPEKQYVTVKVPLHPEQKRLYKEAVENERIELPDGATAFDVENALTRALRLKQICGTTATMPGFEDHSFKLDRAIEMTAEMLANGQHLVVFTQFRGVQEAFVNRLKALKCPVYQLHGGVKMNERQGVVREWSSTSEPAVLVAMLQVAGVGLNMTKARSAIFLDKLWVPKLNEQAEDRIHRIGADTTQDITIYQIICSGTVEQRVETILKRKSSLFARVVDESDWKRAIAEALAQEEDDDE